MNYNQLQHAGIKGMRWGVRRYQNKDGSLTPEGKKRYGSDDGDSAASARLAKKQARANKKAIGKNLKSKEQDFAEKKKLYEVTNRGTLTNDDIKARIERIQLEKQLRELTEAEIRPGRTKAMKIVEEVGTKVAKTALTGAALYGLKTLASKTFNSRDFGDSIATGMYKDMFEKADFEAAKQKVKDDAAAAKEAEKLTEQKKAEKKAAKEEKAKQKAENKEQKAEKAKENADKVKAAIDKMTKAIDSKTGADNSPKNDTAEPSVKTEEEKKQEAANIEKLVTKAIAKYNDSLYKG